MLRSHRPLRPFAVLAVLAGVLLLAAPARAQDAGPDADRDDQIVFTGSLVVASDETVDTALIFDGPATVEGTVRDDLVVFNGDTEVSGTVEGNVVVLNGSITVRSSAVIEGDLVTNATPDVEDGATIRGSRQNVATNIDWDVAWFASRFVWWLGYSVSVLILGLLLLAFAPQLDDRIVNAVRSRLGATIGWGAALWFLIPIAAGILLFTVVGTPLGLFLLLGLALIYTLGYVASSVGVGRLVMASSSRYVAFLVGWLILRGLALIPVVGGILWFVARAWGLGLLAVAIRSSARSETPPMAPPPPMPVPA
jgi:hypothetical protein